MGALKTVRTCGSTRNLEGLVGALKTEKGLWEHKML